MATSVRRFTTVFATAALLAQMLFVPAARAAVTQRDVLIKGPGSGATVYYLANDGKRYVFPNQKTYNTWFKDFTGVLTVTTGDLISFSLGGNVTYRPGVRLVKITTDPRVYAVDRGGTLRWITSEAAAVALYGSNWNTKIDDVPDAFFTNYRLGADINGAADFSPTSASSATPTINADRGISVSANPRLSDTTTPVTTPAPTPVPLPVPPSSQTCTADVWVCTTWNACDASGTQVRTCSLSVDCPNSASSKPVELQACIPTSSGSISVDTDSIPGDVVAGTDAVLARFRLSAVNEDLRLTKVSFNVASPVAVSTLSLYDGSTLVASPTPVDGAGNAFFTNVQFTIPRNSSRYLTVKGVINQVGPTGVTTGSNARVTMKDSPSPYVFLLQGTGGSQTTITSIPGGEKVGNDKIVRGALPTVTVTSLPSTVLTPGDIVAARVTIYAGGGDLGLKTLTLDVNKPNAASVSVISDPANSTVRVYGGSYLIGHSTASAGCGASAGTFCQIRSMFNPEEVIAAGSSKTYDVRLSIGGTIVKGDALSTSVLGDTVLVTGALTAGTNPDQVRVGGSDVNFAWSDYSAIPHSGTVGASSADWTSGLYVKNLPTDVQVLVR